jgi:hypothetical protein
MFEIPSGVLPRKNTPSPKMERKGSEVVGIRVGEVTKKKKKKLIVEKQVEHPYWTSRPDAGTTAFYALSPRSQLPSASLPICNGVLLPYTNDHGEAHCHIQ